jgi:GT2 family glycosyltransferase
VVVATHDRAARLGALLASLRGQTVGPARFEVIVVDDASSDGSRAVLESERERGELDLRVIHRDRPEGPSAARNDGWRVARAPIVAFTDDDCTATPGWLEAGLLACSSNPGALVQGRTDPAPWELGQLGPFARTLEVYDEGPYYQTCNVFYPHSLLERLGGFDADAFPYVGEDTDLAWRARAAGAPTAFAPDALVHHAVADLGPVGKLRIAARWTPSMRLFSRHPELRREHLVRGVFWKGSHYLLVRALLGYALRNRWPLFARWLAFPYLLHLLERGRVEGGGPLMAPYHFVHDLVELVAVARGAIRYRTPVL